MTPPPARPVGSRCDRDRGPQTARGNREDRLFHRCPKCGHRPLPADQSLPAACPGCGAILAKLEPAALAAFARCHRPIASGWAPGPDTARQRIASWPLHIPERETGLPFAARLALWLGFAGWGLYLIGLDHRSGEIAGSFIHGPLLVFHEAGHVLFRPFGHFAMVLGGTLGQLPMPALLGVALLWKNRDAFGAALALWLFGVSLLDVAPYLYDALHPQLMLLSGHTGEDGGHDWIDIFGTLGLLAGAQALGGATRALGALTVLAALGWAGWGLAMQASGSDAPDRDD